MFYLISWILFGFIAGTAAKFFHPGEDPIGFTPTVGIGIAGSFIGGMLHSITRGSVSIFEPAGLLWSIIGGIIFCVAYSKYSPK